MSKFGKERLGGGEEGISVGEAFQSLLEQAAQENVIHGYVLAAGRKDKLLLRTAGGNLGGAGSPPVTETTRYDLDALTQVMVTTPLLLLALERGLLSIHDPIALYMHAPADKRPITLQHLLTHTGGMGDGFLLEQEAENDADAFRALLAHPLEAQPGKRVRYSSLGFLLLGKVLEQVYGASLDTAAKKYIFAPLGLNRTGYLPIGGDIAFTEADALTGEPRIGAPNEKNTRFLHGVSGAAGVFSDMDDCLRFLSMLSCGGVLDGQMFLTPESVRLFLADHTQGKKEGRGLGFQLADRECPFLGELWPRGCYGLMGATGTAVAVDPVSGVYVALLSNRVQMAHENRAFLRFLRLLLNSAYAQALRQGL